VSHLARAALALALTAWAAGASAQIPRPFALQTWEPASPGDPFFAVPGAQVPAHLVPSAGLALSWAADPLVLRVDGQPVPGGRIVHRQFQGFLQGGLGFAGRVLFDAGLPVALYQSGSRPIPDLPQVASTGLGDLRLGARAALPPLGWAATAAQLDLWLPTGSRDAFTTDGAVRVGLKSMAGGRIGPVEVGGSFGLLYRSQRDLAVTHVGTGLTWSAGAAWCQGPWRIGPELFGRFQFQGTETSPAEVLLGGHWTRGAIVTGVAVGTQLDKAPGAAPFRLLATVGWRPEAKAAIPEPEPVPAPAPPPEAAPMPEPPPPAAPEPAPEPAPAAPPPVLAEPPPPPPEPVPPPAPLVKLTAEKIEILSSVQFETDRDVIRPESEPVLREVAAVFAAHPELTRVRIEGHTDSQGGVEHNTALSARRALAVKAWLVAHGIDAGRLETAGYGPSRPIDTNATKEGRARNRRVEFTIL